METQSLYQGRNACNISSTLILPHGMSCLQHETRIWQEGHGALMCLHFSLSISNGRVQVDQIHIMKTIHTTVHMVRILLFLENVCENVMFNYFHIRALLLNKFFFNVITINT